MLNYHPISEQAFGETYRGSEALFAGAVARRRNRLGNHRGLPDDLRHATPRNGLIYYSYRGPASIWSYWQKGVRSSGYEGIVHSNEISFFFENIFLTLEEILLFRRHDFSV